MPQLNLLRHMDSEEKQDDAMEVNNDGVDVGVDASSPEANKEPDSDSVVLVTPDAVRENGDIQVQSPLTLTVVRKQLKLARIDSDDSVSGSGSPPTPEHDVYHLFAPGPDHMVWAPQCNKYLRESRNTVACRLDLTISLSRTPSFTMLPNQNPSRMKMCSNLCTSVFSSLLFQCKSQTQVWNMIQMIVKCLHSHSLELLILVPVHLSSQLVNQGTFTWGYARSLNSDSGFIYISRPVTYI